MRHTEQLVDVGRSAAHVLLDQESWIHRRVESLTFPLPDEPVYRRHVSIDFSIPTGLRPVDSGTARRAARFYVPLSVVTKWPPLHRLDLRSESGVPIPFLTGKQNKLLDASALVELAVVIAGPQTQLSDDEKRRIARIPLSRGDESVEAFEDALPSVDKRSLGTLSPALDVLRADARFMGLAQALRRNTILWLRVEGDHDDREIVKFAYDLTWGNRLGFFDKASFGLAPLLFEFETPHVGSSGSYHLNIAAPAPLRAVNSEIVLYDSSREKDPSAPIDPATVKHIATPGHPVRLTPDGFEAFTEVRSRHAKFYVAGRRDGLAGRVYVAVRPEAEGFLRGASLAAGAITATLLAFAMLSGAVRDEREATVAVLLIAPVVLSYLLVRPFEHALVGGLLAGLRRLAISSGVWPVAAAVLVVLLDSATSLRWALLAIALGSLLSTIGLLGPLIQTWYDGRRNRRQLGRMEPEHQEGDPDRLPRSRRA